MNRANFSCHHEKCEKNWHLLCNNKWAIVEKTAVNCVIVLIVQVRKIFEFELLGEIWCLGGDMQWFSILQKIAKIIQYYVKDDLMWIFNCIYIFEPLILHTPTGLCSKMIMKYVNLVDTGEILPMVPQIVVKACPNTHFWGNKIEILIYSWQNIAIYEFEP